MAVLPVDQLAVQQKATWVKFRKGMQKHPNRHFWLLPGGSAVLCDELLMQFPATERTSHPES